MPGKARDREEMSGEPASILKPGGNAVTFPLPLALLAKNEVI
jgi:hypothetical protein